MDWSALPTDALTQLDCVKKLLADKELSDDETSAKNLVDLLFKQNQVKEPVISPNCNEEVLIIDDNEDKLEDVIEIVDEEPPAKLAKYSIDTPKDDSNMSANMFADVLENGGNIEETIQEMSELPNETLKTTFESSSRLISSKGLLNLTDFLVNNLLAPHPLLIPHCLAPALVQLESLPRGLLENLENILQKLPSALRSVTTASLVSRKHLDVCLQILQPIANEVDIKQILLGWIPPVDLDQYNLDILERVLNLGPRVLEDMEVAAVILVGLAKEAEGQRSSPNFGKFMVFFIKNLPNVITKENYDRIEGIVGKNKTFLRKAMENNLKKRTISG